MKPKQPFSWFAAIAKARADKQIVVVALVEEAGSGSQIAAPIVRKVIEEHFEVKTRATSSRGRRRTDGHDRGGTRQRSVDVRVRRGRRSASSTCDDRRRSPGCVVMGLLSIFTRRSTRNRARCSVSRRPARCSTGSSCSSCSPGLTMLAAVLFDYRYFKVYAIVMYLRRRLSCCSS